MSLKNVEKNNIETMTPRIERKFYLAPEKTHLALGLLRHICRPDNLYPSEQINSLYFDTSNLEQYDSSDSGDYAKDKVRLRWYGEKEKLFGNIPAFIELKSRRGFISTKHRLKINLDGEILEDFDLLNNAVSPEMLKGVLASFGYFPLQKLAPIILISYWRYRFSEVTTGQRVSLDIKISSAMVKPSLGHGRRAIALPGGVIEIKGEKVELPYLLRKMQLLEVDWTRFSKYSACLESHIELPGTVGYTSPSGRIIEYP